MAFFKIEGLERLLAAEKNKPVKRTVLESRTHTALKRVVEAKPVYKANAAEPAAAENAPVPKRTSGVRMTLSETKDSADKLDGDFEKYEKE